MDGGDSPLWAVTPLGARLQRQQAEQACRVAAALVCASDPALAFSSALRCGLKGERNPFLSKSALLVVFYYNRKKKKPRTGNKAF